MKLELNLYYSRWDSAKNRELMAQTCGLMAEYHIPVKTVTVEIPDDVEFTDKQFNNALYHSQLTAAEKVVAEKMAELTKAQEVVKNMLAIPAEVVDSNE